VPAIAAAFYKKTETARVRLGMTKLALAEQADISRVTYDRLATLENAPLPSTIIRIAAVLDLDRDEALHLAGLIDQPTPAQAAERRVRAAMVDAIRYRLPDVDEPTIARVAFVMGEILQGLAVELHEQHNRVTGDEVV
jgi:transcriptional regulator with XRE-family HTH domain